MKIEPERVAFLGDVHMNTAFAVEAVEHAADLAKSPEHQHEWRWDVKVLDYDCACGTKAPHA